MNVVVTGARGFIGRNLVQHLSFRKELNIYMLDRSSDETDWKNYIRDTNIVIHLAGVNRTTDPGEFDQVNLDLTAFILDKLEETGKTYKLLYASSTQATLNNDYGNSKKKAEEYLSSHIKNGEAAIYRLPGVFGKWAKPNYNSVVATFCYNIAHSKEAIIHNKQSSLNLVYIDDVCDQFLKDIDTKIIPGNIEMKVIYPVYKITVGELASIIESFRESRKNLFLPEVGDPLTKKLYSTFLSYLPEDRFAYELDLKTDNRGSLFELLKSPAIGQVFLSSTNPGITRGNHFHHTKTEKFCVIVGEGLIQFRKPEDKNVIEYRVSGKKPKIIDIPPGYTHNITNIGTGEMITLFWANEVFDTGKPDTYFLPV
jgi:UDP-2-acetamido-2,6-beta-L-arabino-hexul-4-ose reductase